jgi:hypothetical protein
VVSAACTFEAGSRSRSKFSTAPAVLRISKSMPYKVHQWPAS